MEHEFEDALSAQERKALESLLRERQAPSALEERTVASLKDSGLINATGTSRSAVWPRISLAFAASLALMFVGALAGVWWTSSPSTDSNASKFMLILRSPSQRVASGSGDEQLRINEYSAWARQIRQSGILVGGEKLTEEIRVLSSSNGGTFHANETSSPEPGSIAGYFVLHASNYDEAMKIAAGCPHLKYGGTIEVREIQRL